MRHTMKMREHGYPGKGFCIYCMESFPPEQLTDEHIVPLALSGTLVYKKSVCEKCRDYTNRAFENDALQADLLIPRLLLELRRRKKKTPKQMPPANIILHNNERIDQITLELANYPTLVSFNVFKPAGRLVNIDRGEGLDEIRLGMLNLSLPRSYTYKKVETRHPMNWSAFALTLAKIGYCYAAAEIGTDRFDGREIRDLLLGKRTDIMNYVGGALVKDFVPENQLHILRLNERNDYVSVVVNLFASYGAMRYEVFVGRPFAEAIQA